MIILNEYKKLDNTYQDDNNKKTVKLAKQLATFTDEDISIKLDNNHLIIMVTSDSPINFRYIEYQKQYSFGLWYRLPYINYDDVSRLEKTMKKPNNIGVLNAKKVNDWITYYKKLYFELKNLSLSKHAKIDAFVINFKETLANLEDKEEYSYYRQGMSPSYPDQDKKPDGSHSGCLTRKGIRYEFTIDSNSGYISQKIEIHYKASNDISTFLALSDNKL